MKMKLLDCTLRDGGHVNNADFGEEVIKGIIRELVDSGIDYVELGFLKDGKFSKNQALYTDVSEIYPLLPEDIKNTMLTVMIRPDWYDIRQLSESDGRIQRIRFAFYYKDFALMKNYSEIASAKGYRFICNPVNIMGYSKDELKELIQRVNEIHPEQFTMVDTYGAMKRDDLHRLYEIIENSLDPDIRMGLHLHENQSLAYCLAQEFCAIKEEKREAVIDASLLGMGRIPGNLCLELIAEYINEKYRRNYDTGILYRVIGECIEPIKKQTAWGYSPAYFITAKYNMHRSYAEYLSGKSDLKLYDIHRILEQIEKPMRSEFHQDYAEKKYKEYKEMDGNE